MTNYAPNTPRDKDSAPKDGYPPAKVALATTHKENASASSILLLNQNTTEVEIAAPGTGAVGKWLSLATIDSSVAGTSVISGAAGGPNFDFVVSQNTQRRFVVPVVAQVLNFGAAVSASSMYGLAAGVALKSLVGNTSVLTVEF